MIDLKDKKVVVVGLARTGMAVAKYSREQGARVLVTEKSRQPHDPAQAQSLRDLGVELQFGPHRPDVLAGADLVVPSPGISPSTPIVEKAIDQNLTVISEIELAFKMTKRPIIAVTGTNGKTTTIVMIGAILRSAGIAADVCGNIGHPMIEALRSKGRDAPLVVEVSSFQLQFTKEFRPDVAVLLNVTRDHLDWHSDFNAYVEAKVKMFEHQKTSDWAVAAVDDVHLIESTLGHKILFGGASGGVFLQNDWITHDMNGENCLVMPVSQLFMRGDHNLSNAMAAVAVALVRGVDEATIAQALSDFKGVEHRLEPVLQDGGIIFYNDSKATNPEAAVKALQAFKENVILLAGGRNKGNDFDDLARQAAGRVGTAILFGEAATELAEAFSRHGVSTLPAESLEEAVRLAKEKAEAGQVVLLSPACASFDMFTDYEERGRCFKEAVAAEVGSIGKV